MTDVQLYLAIGVPTLAVLLGILTNSMQMSAMNTRISSLENRVDGRFNGLEARFDARFSGLETRVDARFNNLDVKFDTLTGKVVDIDNRVTRIEAKLDIS